MVLENVFAEAKRLLGKSSSNNSKKEARVPMGNCLEIANKFRRRAF